MSHSRLLGLRGEESRVIRHVKRPRCGEASCKIHEISDDRTQAIGALAHVCFEVRDREKSFWDFGLFWHFFSFGWEKKFSLFAHFWLFAILSIESRGPSLEGVVEVGTLHLKLFLRAVGSRFGEYCERFSWSLEFSYNRFSIILWR